MSNIEIYKKPELAVISDSKKMRSYNEVERRAISSKIVLELLVKLGVGKNSNEEHHLEAIKYISKNKEFAPEEFTKAFELVLSGVLKIELFQQVNCLIIGKVMNLYKNHKNEKLKVYRQKLQLKENKQSEISDEEKHKLFINGIKTTFEEYKETGVIPNSRLYLYYEFFKMDGVLPKDSVTKKAIYKESCERIKKLRVLSRQDKEISKIIKPDGNPNNEVLNECKRLSLERLFNRFTIVDQLLMKIK